MKTWTLTLILFFALVLLSGCASSGDGESKTADDDDTTDDDTTADDDVTIDDDAIDDDVDDDIAYPDTWTDSTSGLMWQNGEEIGSEFYTWQEAQDYCTNLSWGGHSDWRLPTISDLRSLIRGCSATMTGGSCGVTDDCLTDACFNESCRGCSYLGGPGPGGAYWPPLIIGVVTHLYWSFSWVADEDGLAWFVDFSYGIIGNGYVDHAHVARCVR